MAYPRVNYKGFKTEVGNARAVMHRCGLVYVLYVKGRGFIFRGDLRDGIELDLESGKISLVGCYKAPLRSPELVDDLECQALLAASECGGAQDLNNK